LALAVTRCGWAATVVAGVIVLEGGGVEGSAGGVGVVAGGFGFAPRVGFGLRLGLLGLVGWDPSAVDPAETNCDVGVGETGSVRALCRRGGCCNNDGMSDTRAVVVRTGAADVPGTATFSPSTRPQRKAQSAQHAATTAAWMKRIRARRMIADYRLTSGWTDVGVSRDRDCVPPRRLGMIERSIGCGHELLP
jgi:hypothetical protein